MCVLYVGCGSKVKLLCKEEGSSLVSEITERRDMDLYEVSLSVFIVFWDGDYVSQLPYVWDNVGVKSRFQHAHKECESKRVYVF